MVCHSELIYMEQIRSIAYLSAQVEIAEKNCSFRTGDDQDDEDEEEESEHVVRLIGPNRVQNEE